MQVASVTHIQALYNALIKAGLKVNIWKNQRIYLNGYGKDISAFFIFDDPENILDGSEKQGLLSGTSIKVYTSAGEGQWAINRKKEVLHTIAADLSRAGISKHAPPDDFQDMILTPDLEARAWIH